MVKVLLEAKSDVNQSDNDGCTALHFAAREGYNEVVKILLEGKAEVNQKDHDGWTALRLAAFYGYNEMVKILLEAKAEVNSTSNTGRTALHFGCQKGNKDVVTTLLAANADVNVKEKDGDTALHKSIYCGKVDVVQVVLEAKADIKLRNAEGQSALDMALEAKGDTTYPYRGSEKAYEEIIKILEDWQESLGVHSLLLIIADTISRNQKILNQIKYPISMCFAFACEYTHCWDRHRELRRFNREIQPSDLV